MMHTLKKIMYALFVCLAGCFLTVATAQEKNILSVKGLKDKVEVLRDQWGVNHIYAGNQHDLFFAQGYCAAKDRLFQFEIWRRQATGTVAELLGPAEIKRDMGTRLFRFRGDMQKEMAHYHPQGVAIITAYTEGVNAYIAEVLLHREKLPIEFRLLNTLPGKWTPEVVVSRHQGLLGNITEELGIGMAVAKAGEKKVREIMWFHPKDPLIRLDTAIQGELLSAKILEPYNAYRKDVVFSQKDIQSGEEDPDAVMNLNRQIQQNQHRTFEHGLEGSNNWVVSGKRTASGNTMLANDPHRKIAVPSLRYMVHLVAPGWNVTGGGEPEIPGVSIGHNEHGAWGLTIYETDGEDLYVYDLNPANLLQYRYKGNWVNMKEIQETIPVKNESPQKVILRYTLHGPVTYIDSLNHKAYAVKCAWLEPGGAPYLASLRIDQAQNWASFREACRYSNIPGENMIWADKQGNIGWQAVGIIPIRKNFSGLVPVSGDGRYEWAGYLPIKERPHLLNPAKGFFATANQNVTPDTYSHWDAVGYTWADPYRGNRINDVLKNDGKMNIPKMEALQTDYFSLPASTLVPMLQNIGSWDAMTTTALEKVLAWDFKLTKESIAAGVYAMWEKELMTEAKKRFIPVEIAGLLGFQLSKLIAWLNMPDEKFGDDPIAGRNAFLAMTFEKAVSALAQKLGRDISQWTYGQEKYKHISLQHPLTSVVGATLKKKLDMGPLARGGNSHTPGATGGSDNQQSGASFRMIVDTGDWDAAVMINTPGQSGNPESPFYKNLFELWANDQYFPAYYSKEKIRKVTVETLVLQPAIRK